MKIHITVPKERSGCYVLMKERRVIYVGQSTDVITRLAGHREKDFDAIEVYWTPHAEAVVLEKRLIALHRPKHNIALNKPTINVNQFNANFEGFRACDWMRKKGVSRKLREYRETCGVAVPMLALTAELKLSALEAAESYSGFLYRGLAEKLELGYARIALAAQFHTEKSFLEIAEVRRFARVSVNELKMAQEFGVCNPDKLSDMTESTWKWSL